MQQVACSCVKCNHRLGELLNLWIQIGKSYISPIIPSERDLKITPSGSVRLGDRQTLVDSCRLQNVACAKCWAIIGLRLTDTPINHVLQKGQLFLRLSSLVITDLGGANAVKVIIQRTLKLKEPSRNGVATGDTPTDFWGGLHPSQDHNGSSSEGDQFDQFKPDHLQEEIRRLDKAGYQMVSSFNNALIRTQGEVKKLKEEMSDLQHNLTSNHSKTLSIDEDITLIKGELKQARKLSEDKASHTDLEQEIVSTNQTITDMRMLLNSKLEDANEEHQRRQATHKSELDHAQQNLREVKEELDSARDTARESISTARAYAKDVVSLKAELKQLREEFAQDRSRKSTQSDPVFPAQEIDILTSNITKIGQRASHIESLQMEFELLKGRVQRLEARTPTLSSHSDMDHLHMSSSDPRQGRPRKKRSRSPDPAVIFNSETPSVTPVAKRQPPDRDLFSSSSPINCDSMSSPPSVRTQKPDTEFGDSPRLTKSGAVDKRYLKRSLRDPQRGKAKNKIPNG
ncbi:hypothetical protein F4779DRAFT_414583 [Xylariaceae sp. FL0662B]|nr:hypothetical protein F4779DRAFT_414583 [Xylariaceae sp. FL0662B]